MKLYSHRNVFHDGAQRLHLCFRHDGKLYALTSRKPQQTPYVEVPAEAMRGPHIKPRVKMYCTFAYNQRALRYNDLPAGEIDIDFIAGFNELNSIKIVHP